MVTHLNLIIQGWGERNEPQQKTGDEDMLGFASSPTTYMTLCGRVFMQKNGRAGLSIMSNKCKLRVRNEPQQETDNR